MVQGPGRVEPGRTSTGRGGAGLVSRRGASEGAWSRDNHPNQEPGGSRPSLGGLRDGGDQGRWKVFGEDLDGDELVCVVTIEAGVVVVTVY